jgi:hypothetical protein
MRREVVLSDFSGAEIPVGTGAVVTVKFCDPRKGVRVLDLTDQEASGSADVSANGAGATASAQRQARLPEVPRGQRGNLRRLLWACGRAGPVSRPLPPIPQPRTR